MTVIEKVAYLRGLADGLKLTDTTAEGKVLLNVIEVLDDLDCEGDCEGCTGCDLD